MEPGDFPKVHRPLPTPPIDKTEQKGKDTKVKRLSAKRGKSPSKASHITEKPSDERHARVDKSQEDLLNKAAKVRDLGPPPNTPPPAPPNQGSERKFRPAPPSEGRTKELPSLAQLRNKPEESRAPKRPPPPIPQRRNLEAGPSSAAEERVGELRKPKEKTHLKGSDYQAMPSLKDSPQVERRSSNEGPKPALWSAMADLAQLEKVAPQKKGAPIPVRNAEVLSKETKLVESFSKQIGDLERFKKYPTSEEELGNLSKNLNAMIGFLKNRVTEAEYDSLLNISAKYIGEAKRAFQLQESHKTDDLDEILVGMKKRLTNQTALKEVEILSFVDDFNRAMIKGLAVISTKDSLMLLMDRFLNRNEVQSFLKGNEAQKLKLIDIQMHLISDPTFKSYGNVVTDLNSINIQFGIISDRIAKSKSESVGKENTYKLEIQPNVFEDMRELYRTYLPIISERLEMLRRVVVDPQLIQQGLPGSPAEDKNIFKKGSTKDLEEAKMMSSMALIRESLQAPIEIFYDSVRTILKQTGNDYIALLTKEGRIKKWEVKELEEEWADIIKKNNLIAVSNFFYKLQGRDNPTKL